MTVPGKGGRPRKWKSDADRVRAYRARQRGDQEPPTVDVALAAGDEAATAWERVRELGVELTEQRRTVKRLRADLRAAERQLDDQRRRFDWLQGENERLRSQLVQLQQHGGPGPDASSGRRPDANRAARRRSERARRRQ